MFFLLFCLLGVEIANNIMYAHIKIWHQIYN